ncbi:Hsp70 family protein [Rhodococcus maanshanensis]|uniref:Hsp70 protein n=1 Tax=Rhodococcus maanshanensis TaxID=183556 RepID=A0A1H7YL52_9NOCA|nr:Hsp70 family protein [Rhodococcus maanshanensis]SEM45849.1 Hsp70 protein [Rhodococcus maanshanensis]
MTPGIGLTIGTVNAAAAVLAGDGTPTHTLTRPAVLSVDASAPPRLDVPSDSATAVTGFAARIGDPVPIIAGNGLPFSGQDLVAAAARGLLAALHAHDPTSASAPAALTYPAVTSGPAVAALREALDAADLPDVELVPEPTAAAAWLEAEMGPLEDELVLVYDLGGSSLDLCMVTAGPGDRRASIVGRPLRSTEFGGRQFDELLARHALATARAEHGRHDVARPGAIHTLAAAQRSAEVARIGLSSATNTVLDLPRPDGGETKIKVSRPELEALVTGPLIASLDLVRECLQSARVEPAQLRHVLLTGGCAAMPLFAGLLADELRIPVVCAPDPATTAARGAAILAAARPRTAVPPMAARTSAAGRWVRRTAVAGIAAGAILALPFTLIAPETTLIPEANTPTVEGIPIPRPTAGSLPGVDISTAETPPAAVQPEPWAAAPAVAAAPVTYLPTIGTGQQEATVTNAVFEPDSDRAHQREISVAQQPTPAAPPATPASSPSPPASPTPPTEPAPPTGGTDSPQATPDPEPAPDDPQPQPQPEPLPPEPEVTLPTGGPTEPYR